MTLDVQPPDPPELTDPESGETSDAVDIGEDASEDYRRDEIEERLADGAWADGFEAWTTQTGLTESEFRLAVRHGLFDKLDFYWHPVDGEVGYHVPDLSDDAREALVTDAHEVESELDALARVVAETLENEG